MRCCGKNRYLLEENVAALPPVCLPFPTWRGKAEYKRVSPGALKGSVETASNKRPFSPRYLPYILAKHFKIEKVLARF